jgi:S-adenosylmethionine synthetase
MYKKVMFTSESVTEGHPDKLCDQIADAAIDQFLVQDPYSRIRVECAVSSAILFIAANFSSKAVVDLAGVARKVIKRIGYNQADFNPTSCSILTAPQALSLKKRMEFETDNISDRDIDKLSSKNQVTLFGFACDQTPVLMPLPIYLAQKLAMQLTLVRKQMHLPYLSPDGKVQVGVTYRDNKPDGIHSVTVTANQLAKKKPSLKTLRGDVLETVIKPVFAEESLGLNSKTKIHINPDGAHRGGPTKHSGLSGRKNAIDTYGEYSRHSGKALSGKDPLRIDRIGAYVARYAAKNVVAAGLSGQCEIMLSYSIGQTRPVSLQVQTFGTGKVPDERIAQFLQRHFDFRLAGILKQFNLRRLPAESPGGFFERLAAYGHFGRTDMELPWEKTDKAETLAGDVA